MKSFVPKTFFPLLIFVLLLLSKPLHMPLIMVLQSAGHHRGWLAIALDSSLVPIRRDSYVLHCFDSLNSVCIFDRVVAMSNNVVLLYGGERVDVRNTYVVLMKVAPYVWIPLTSIYLALVLRNLVKKLGFGRTVALICILLNVMVLGMVYRDPTTSIRSYVDVSGYYYALLPNGSILLRFELKNLRLVTIESCTLKAFHISTSTRCRILNESSVIVYVPRKFYEEVLRYVLRSTPLTSRRIVFTIVATFYIQFDVGKLRGSAMITLSFDKPYATISSGRLRLINTLPIEATFQVTIQEDKHVHTKHYVVQPFCREDVELDCRERCEVLIDVYVDGIHVARYRKVVDGCGS